jgi:predicted amidophosphoribosyltransferase
VDCISSGIVPTKLGNWQQDLTHGNHLDAAYSLFWYDDIVHECVHTLKYFGSIKAVHQLIEAIELPTIDVDSLIPKPLYHSRQREWGYNQAQVISIVLSEKLSILVNSQLLKRMQWTSSQTKLDNIQRKINIENKFQCIAEPPL